MERKKLEVFREVEKKIEDIISDIEVRWVTIYAKPWQLIIEILRVDNDAKTSYVCNKTGNKLGITPCYTTALDEVTYKAIQGVEKELIDVWDAYISNLTEDELKVCAVEEDINNLLIFNDTTLHAADTYVIVKKGYCCIQIDLYYRLSGGSLSIILEKGKEITVNTCTYFSNDINANKATKLIIEKEQYLRGCTEKLLGIYDPRRKVFSRQLLELIPDSAIANITSMQEFLEFLDNLDIESLAPKDHNKNLFGRKRK